MRLLSSAPCRRLPLISNVRHQNMQPLAPPAGSATRGVENQAATSGLALPDHLQSSSQASTGCVSCRGHGRVVQLPVIHRQRCASSSLGHGTGSVSQFFGPTAVGSIAASLGFRSGGRQVTGTPNLVSAERKRPQGVNRINPCGGTVNTFAPLAALMPNLSFKRSANGMSRWPSSAGPSAHFALAVQRAMPLSPA